MLFPTFADHYDWYFNDVKQKLLIVDGVIFHQICTKDCVDNHVFRFFFGFPTQELNVFVPGRAAPHLSKVRRGQLRAHHGSLVDLTSMGV